MVEELDINNEPFIKIVSGGARMKILVIGGSRFVGPYLVEMLLEKGCAVTVFNRGSVPCPKGAKFIQGDRNQPFQIQEHFDVVVDMVAYTGDQARTAVEQLKFDFMVHVGTAASYKKSGEFPLKEDFPLGDWPVWGAYNKGKVDCENVLKKSGIKYASIRPVFILGPENFADREKFIYTRIKKGETLILPGNGEAVIQFVFAKETAEAIALLATKRIEGNFNCCGTEAITVNGLVEEMGKLVGKKPVVKHNHEADGKSWKIDQFPFANENFFCSNEKLKKLGVHFSPLISQLKADYEIHYKKILD